MLICFKCIKHTELDHYEIYYSINNDQMNNKSHDFSFTETLNLEGIVNPITKCKLL